MPINVLKMKWNMRYEDAKDSAERLLNLWNDFYLSHEEEINLGFYWYIKFYKKVMDRYEEVISKVSA